MAGSSERWAYVDQQAVAYCETGSAKISPTSTEMRGISFSATTNTLDASPGYLVPAGTKR